MVNKLAGFGQIQYGIFNAGPPASSSATAKRSHDNTPKHPPKRQRTERIEVDQDHVTDHNDVTSIPSSSEMVAQPLSASSSHRRGPQDNHSQQTNGDKHATGNGVAEFRHIDLATGMRRGRRSRHGRNSYGRQSHGSWDDDVQKTTPVKASRSKPSLHQLQEAHKHPIQSYEDVTSPIEPRSSGADGRASARVPGKPSHTGARFAVQDASSEDELNAPPPTVPQQEPEGKKQRIPERQAKSGSKRAAEHDESGQQPMHLAKRRSDNTSKADLHRTKFSSGATHTKAGHDGLRISRAVCGPTYVYPAEGTMHETISGASNKPCRLVPVENRKSCFEVVDEAGNVMPELKWITPNMGKIKKIISHPLSGTVQLTKSRDFEAKFATGPFLYLDFELSHIAEDYVKQCSTANPSIVIGTSSDM